VYTRLTSYLKILANKILDFLFPPTLFEARLRSLSAREINQLPRIDIAALPDDTYALFSYRHQSVRGLIWLFKFKKDRHITEIFAHILHEEIIGLLGEEELPGQQPILLIPIPLGPQRQQERGYNQCELLGQAIVSLDRNDTLRLAPQILIKTKDTPSQTSLSRSERLKNLHDCFTVPTPELIRNRTVILLDDVTTTGATFAAARRALLKASAKRIITLAIAH
jgi:ComF family protein